MGFAGMGDVGERGAMEDRQERISGMMRWPGSLTGAWSHLLA